MGLSINDVTLEGRRGVWKNVTVCVEEVHLHMYQCVTMGEGGQKSGQKSVTSFMDSPYTRNSDLIFHRL